jgi:hypothetical protein
MQQIRENHNIVQLEKGAYPGTFGGGKMQQVSESSSFSSNDDVDHYSKEDDDDLSDSGCNDG